MVEIIEEEVRGRIFELLEDEDSRKPDSVSADEEAPKKKKGKGTPDGARPTTAGSDVKPVGTPANAAVDAEEGDDGQEDELAAIDQDGSAGKNPSGAVNDELSGKTVQGISIEPKSKILPGAKEVIVTFNETTDPLRILCTGSGQVKFFYRGQLHDLP